MPGSAGRDDAVSLAGTGMQDAPASWWRRLALWAARHNLANRLAVVLAMAAVASGMATYAAMVDLPPFGNDPNTISLLLTLSMALLLLLGVVTARRIVTLWLERRRGLAGAKLHARLVAIFSLLTALPAIIMATFAAIFFYVGVQSWFSERVSTAVNEALAVAEAYVKEHQRTIEADLLAAVADLQFQSRLIRLDQDSLRQMLLRQAIDRNFTEIVVFDGLGREIARHGLLFAFEPDQVPARDLDRARRGEIVTAVSEDGNRVTAMVRIDPDFDTFMYVGRPVEASVLASMESTQSAVNEYRELEGKRFDLQTRLTLIFLAVALLLLMGAIWAGLNFATYLVQPISALIGAAERVSEGDLSARVPEGAGDQEDELSTLTRVFNRMTMQLETQRGDLVEANRLLDLRRRFTEAVLAGVSAGVVGLDQEGRINLPNLSAVHLLDAGTAETLIGQRLEDLAPEFSPIMEAIRRRPTKLVEDQVQLRRGSHVRTLLVRVSAELVGGEVRGYVVTFDDVSELVSAQRKAAWADVARRIAHEIKNPLTPIQLSAERLRRKYLKEISSDPDTFRQMTDTIVRHVDDIGRMVDEFSAFARMPQPVMKPVAMQDLCRQTTFLQSTAQPTIRFVQDLPDPPLVIVCDGRLLAQALTNLLKNAVEAIEGRAEEQGPSAPPGEVVIRLTADEEQVTIAVEDNGKGLPTAERDRLAEPYVTTRAKGTGLGLAIVKKIMEDHGGVLTLEDRPGGGARVGLTLPRTLAATSTEAGSAPEDGPALTAGRKG
ncbi:MAG: Nitrogen regulation protein NtrY [Pseudomonadota bacterium]|jgi:two-component system nitrogen regulation sensor histidine kinase NtrY